MLGDALLSLAYQSHSERLMPATVNSNIISYMNRREYNEEIMIKAMKNTGQSILANFRSEPDQNQFTATIAVNDVTIAAKRAYNIF